MQCSDIEDRLSSYLDHELPLEEISFVEKHLQYCPTCQKILADLQRTSSLLQSLPYVPIPDGFQEHFHEILVGLDQDTYISEKGSLRQNWLQRFWGSYRIVSVALILFFCFATYSFSIFYKNMSDMEQAPALMNAEIAFDQADTSDLNQKAFTRSIPQSNEDSIKPNKSKGYLIIILAVAIVVPFLIVRINSKLRRKK